LEPGLEAIVSGWCAYSVAMRRLLVVVLPVLLAGCGSNGSGDVTGPVSRHLRALSEGDFGAACSELSLEAQGEAIGFVAQAGRPPRSCAAAYRSLRANGSLDFARAGVMDLARARRYGRVALKVEVLDAGPAHAHARVSGSSKVIDLERGGGGWKIARLDFSDVP
jgi:hypothetical protein